MSELEKVRRELATVRAELDSAKLQIQEQTVPPRTWADNVDEFVDEWYENNKDDVDIGQIKIAGRWKVDLIPDELEKRIYKKILKIVISMIENIKFSPSPLVK